MIAGVIPRSGFCLTLFKLAVVEVVFLSWALVFRDGRLSFCAILDGGSCGRCECGFAGA